MPRGTNPLRSTPSLPCRYVQTSDIIRTYGTAYAGLTVPKWGSGTAAILVTPTRTEPSAERHVPSNSTRGLNTKRGSETEEEVVEFPFAKVGEKL